MTWWEYPTNYSNGTEVSGVADFFFKFPSFIIGGKYNLGITIMIWVMCFALSMQSGSRKAIMIASFITLIFSIWITIIVGGAINIAVMFILIFLTIMGAVLGSEGSGGGL